MGEICISACVVVRCTADNTRAGFRLTIGPILHSRVEQQISPCLREKPSSRTLICPRTCSRMQLTVPHKPLRNTTLRRTSLPSSRKSSTRSTTPPGTPLWAETSAVTSRTRPSTSSTSTWDKSPSCYLNLDKKRQPYMCIRDFVNKETNTFLKNGIDNLFPAVA